MSKGLALARGAMELCWVFAWCTATLAMVSARPFPLSSALGMFASAVLLTRWFSGPRERWQAPLQAAGALVCALYELHGLFAPATPFTTPFWLTQLAGQTPAAWRVAAAFVAWALALWIAGCRCALRPAAYLDVCARFDRGLLWLFALLFIKLLLRQQPGVWQVADRSEALILPYFVFGLTAIGVARNRSDGRRSFMRGRRGLGFLVAFGALVLACGLGVTLACLPFLHQTSEQGYAQLVAFAGPLGPIVVELVLFLLRGRAVLVLMLPNKRPVVPVADTPARPELHMQGDGLESPAVTSFWLVVSVVLLACGIAWTILRWRALGQGKPAVGWLAAWRQQLRGWLARWQRFVTRRRQAEAIRLYRALLAWGRRSGIAARASDTPLEYAGRLKRQLGAVSVEIDSIVAPFNAHVYGPPPELAALRAARRALLRLHSPRLWLQRMAAWRDSEAAQP